MRSSSRPAHRRPSQTHHPTSSRPQPRFTFLKTPSAMFSTFNIIRASIYCTFISPAKYCGHEAYRDDKLSFFYGVSFAWLSRLTSRAYSVPQISVSPTRKTLAGSSISLTALSFSIARFVPFAIFVSSATLAIILVLCVYRVIQWFGKY
jgi:hypothetical protein